MQKINNIDRKQQTNLKNNCSKFVVCAFSLLFFFNMAGCSHIPHESPNRRPLLEKLAIRKNESEVEETVLSQTDLILKVNGRPRRLKLAPNSKRLLIERSLTFDETDIDYPASFALLKSLAEESPNSVGIELWNIEFSDARLESISQDRIGLIASTFNCAAFDEKGSRLFWTARNSNKQTQSEAVANNSSAIFENSESNPKEFSIEYFDNVESTSLTPVTKSPKSVVQPNVIFTKPLETNAFKQAEKKLAFDLDGEVKRLKTSDEVKKAECVWLSPNAHWLVCRNTTKQIDFPPTTQFSNVDQEWTLTLLRDKKRVVHFPNSVKMSFENLTSNEKIIGKVVNILAVSDAGDLVATLVEEQLSQNEDKDNSYNTVIYRSSNNSVGNTAPRYKIVIWDLNVAQTVEFEKAKKPLMALEVSQISIPVPVARKYCKFSPTGERFAARVEPRYVTVWQSANGRLCSELGEHNDVVQDFAFAPRSARMIVGVGGKKHAQLVLWEIRKGIVHRTLDDVVSEPKSIEAVAFSNNENEVYFANDLGEVKRWNIRYHSK